LGVIFLAIEAAVDHVLHAATQRIEQSGDEQSGDDREGSTTWFAVVHRGPRLENRDKAVKQCRSTCNQVRKTGGGKVVSDGLAPVAALTRETHRAGQVSSLTI